MNGPIMLITQPNKMTAANRLSFTFNAHPILSDRKYAPAMKVGDMVDNAAPHKPTRNIFMALSPKSGFRARAASVAFSTSILLGCNTEAATRKMITL